MDHNSLMFTKEKISNSGKISYHEHHRLEYISTLSHLPNPTAQSVLMHHPTAWEAPVKQLEYHEGTTYQNG